MDIKNKLRAILFLLPLTFMFTACLDDDGDTIIIPELYEKTPETMLPAYLYDSISNYMPIYSGKKPPKIEGEYLVSPELLDYSSDGGFQHGDQFADLYIKFNKQNTRNQCVYYEKQLSANTICDSAMIVGHDNVFTFIGKLTIKDKENGWRCVTGTLISGKITSSGISDFSYAFYMIEKDDPNHDLMDVGAFRIFYDGDGLVSNYNWYNSKDKHPVSYNGLSSMIARKEVTQ